jgi:hypothetical protein
MNVARRFCAGAPFDYRQVMKRPVAVAGLFLAGLFPAAATASPPPLQPVSPHNLGRVPVVIHDSVVAPHARPRAIHPAATTRGGEITTGDGSRVRVLASSGLGASDAARRSYAELFASFFHGRELGSVTVYLAPFSEMQNVCGAVADSCYDPSTEEIVLVGETPPDGTPIEELAAHEYGHHIAMHRDNRPWPALDWGPKYWASHQRICSRERRGQVFPGNEDTFYSLDPGEGWAETNRVLNGGHDAWGRVDDSFAPRATDLRLARKDILHPWVGPTSAYHRGALGPGHARTASYKLARPLDGRVAISVHTRGHLDADLYLYDASGHQLARSTRTGHYDLIRRTACGWGALRLVVVRYSGSGSYVVHTSLPY